LTPEQLEKRRDIESGHCRIKSSDYEIMEMVKKGLRYKFTSDYKLKKLIQSYKNQDGSTVNDFD
jgi:hypothetical protein